MLGHNHSHSDGHSHGPVNYNRAFALGVALNLAYVILEAGFGLTSRSLALLADAGHNLSDVLSLLLAWAANHLSTVRPSKKRTYGWGRSSIIAALLNAVLLLVAIGGIAWEAVHRFTAPEPVPGGTMMLVAGFGVVINAATALLFMKGRDRDLNIRGAFLHMVADAGVSAAVVLGGFIISRTGLFWIDPLLSLLVVAVIAIGTWGLLRDSFNLSLDAVPPSIDIGAVEKYLESVPGISRVHDLHVWGMSTTKTALTAHLVKPDCRLDDALLATIQAELHERFGIEHMTIQLEAGDEDCTCAQEPPHVV
ncbi:MAG TPA: cation diffusion facilitator family transporter [Chthoniobacterales bacterium]|jgi:cobalt-zinc-cadmium efflux system protein|nr:cation diffusion facilitator family transporter [Chthoniobacterales bacterium]